MYSSETILHSNKIYITIYKRRCTISGSDKTIEFGWNLDVVSD